MSGSSSAPSGPSSSPISSLTLQTSTRGRAVPLVYGKTRVAGNLLWYGDFTSIEHDTTTSSGGKGGGQDSTTTSYSYTAAIIMALCRGPINAITTIWRDKDVIGGSSAIGAQVHNEYHLVPGSPYQIIADRASVYGVDVGVSMMPANVYGNQPQIVDLILGTDYTHSGATYTFASAFSGKNVIMKYTLTNSVMDVSSQAGLTLTIGDAFQLPLGWMTTNHSAQALAYRNIAYVSAPAYSLGDQANLQNHSFEIDTRFAFSDTIRDANPKDIVADLMSNPVSGAAIPPDIIGDTSTFSKYCIANGIFLSPCYQDQEALRDILTRLMQICNTGILLSAGQLKMVPFGDVAVTGNGATYTPNLTPVYNLTDDDFEGDSTEDPVVINRKPQSDSYNCVKVKFRNRANNYNDDVVEAKDQANIELTGLRTLETLDFPEICDANVARVVAQIILQRKLYIRNAFSFKLNLTKCLLEPMDLVTLTEAQTGMVQTPVRILTIEEDSEDLLSVTAEEFPLNVCNAALYNTQASIPYSVNFNVNAGSVSTPLFIEPPIELSESSDFVDIWIATGSTNANYGGCDIWACLDNATYKKVGTLYGSSRYGTTTASLGSEAASGVSSTKTLSVVLNDGGQLISGTLNDCTVFNTLAYVGGEFLAYQTATLTSAAHYNLTVLNRGGYSSGHGSHASGQDFARLDNLIAKIPLTKDYIGKQIYFKFLSFNSVGGGKQNLSDVSPYTFTITGRFAILPPDDLTSFSVSVRANGVREFSWGASTALDVQNGGGYRIKYRTAGSGTAWASMTTLQTGLLTATPYQTNNPIAGSYDFAIVAVDKLGNESTTPLFISSATLTNEPVTYGAAVNMLANSDWVISTGTNSGASALYQWTTSTNISGGSVFVRNGGYSIGRGGAAWSDTGSIGTTNASNLFQQVAVRASTTYEFSALVDVFNATAGLYVQWYDSSNVFISQTTVDTTNNTGVANPKLSDYTQLWGTLTSPSTAAFATVVLYKQATNTGQTSSSVYWQRAFMSLARTGVTRQTSTPWIEAGTDLMHGGGLEPATVDTTQLKNNAATTLLSNAFSSGGTLSVGRVGSAGPTGNSDFTTLLTVTFTPVLTGTVLCTCAVDITFFANAGTVTYFDTPLARVDTGTYVAADTVECNSRTGGDPTGLSSAATANFVFRKYVSVTAGVSTTVTFRALGRSQASYTYTAKNAYLQVEVIKK